MPEIENQIRQFLLENFVLSSQLDELNADDSFLENGVVDSTGILEMIFFAEDHFGIQIDTSEVLPENFDSINCFAAYIRRKQNLQESNDA